MGRFLELAKKSASLRVTKQELGCDISDISDISPTWTATDWRAFYDERAGIAEYDAGLPRDHAEHVAFEQCVAHWLALNKPPAGEWGFCTCCGQPAQPDAVLTTCVGGSPGLIHHACKVAWGEHRREQAVSALGKLGIAEDEQRAGTH